MVVGVGTRASWHEQGVLFGVGYAQATDSKYLQGYFLPDLSGGPIRFTAIVEWYEPIERSGARQLYVNPAGLLVGATRWLSLGAAYTVGWSVGLAVAQRIGPLVEIDARWGILRLEVLDYIAGESTEVRTTLEVSF